MKEPLISVIIPAFNAEKFITRAIDSICLQHYSNLEIIVIDDASTDRTAEIVLELKVKLIRLPHNQGAAVARNTGIVQARGELIAFLDADDEWLPDKLNNQTQALQNNPHLVGVVGFLKIISSHALEPEQISAFFLPSFGTALLKRQIFEVVGLLNPTLRMAEDVDWFNRARETNQAIAVLPSIVLRYQQHETNTTANPLEVRRWLLRALRHRIQRFKGHPPVLAAIPQLEGIT